MASNKEAPHAVYARLNDMCKAIGINITQLCKDITGSSGNTSTWKKGHIRSDYLIAISQYFNVSVDYLLCRMDAKNLSTGECDLCELFNGLDDKGQTAVKHEAYNQADRIAAEESTAKQTPKIGKTA